MKCKTKINLTYLIVLILVIFLSVFTLVEINISHGSIDSIRNSISVSMSDMKNIKFDIIQIQQWLTDASATGYLDGFEIAKEHYDNANRLLEKEIKQKTKTGRKELVTQLEDIQNKMNNYYKVGIEMANNYINVSREAGNVWMDKFDPIAIELTDMVEKQVGFRTGIFNTRLSELSQSQTDISRMIIIIGIIIISIVVFMGIFMYNTLNNGIKLIDLYSSKLENNDITDTIFKKRKDEFGASAGQFRSSFKLLNKLISHIKSSTNATAKIKESLASSANDTSSTIGDIKNSTSDLLKESEKMSKNVTDNVTVIEQITANIGSINNQISNQASMVEESTASITQMMSSLDSMEKITVKKGEAVGKLVVVAETGADTLSSMADGFRVGVVDKIDGISEMASTIQQIASQTNLLSMNAAIEAAHAGDAGKGFAVVADEIRKLADTSAQSSANITRIIKEISEGVSETEIKTKQSSIAFGTINKEINETKQAFDEIASSTQELTAGGEQILTAMTMLQDVTINVKGASEEITLGSEQIVRGQLELKDISEEVRKGMLEISSGSKEIVMASDEIVKLSSDLNSVVNGLKDETDKFTV
ncbi:MAG: hypothetical protein KAH95_09500 [Spirochaetales bacterium]|nr:hypothetical protein [Spirochaetales bacterium]